MNRIQGQRVLVIGLARSGEAVARLLCSHGCSVTVNDKRAREEVQDVLPDLESLGIRGVFGGHPLELLEPAPDFIVKNPGIPYSVPILVQASERGIPIYTEIEVASWFMASPILAITGSNGKTTTTTLVGEILREAGLRPVVAGNIGVAVSSIVQTVEPEQPVVMEVSSFQLLGTEQFHPKMAALLNLYPAHLDYHGTLEEYFDAKWGLFRNMEKGDVVVLNADMPMFVDRAKDLSADIVWFSRTRDFHQDDNIANAVFVRGNDIVVKRHGDICVLLPLRDLALKGEHNLENVLAATAMCLWFGASESAVCHVLTHFSGIEHRLEFVKRIKEADWYNDSKATNPTAAIRALQSFPDSIVWVAGGLNRGDDVSVLVDTLRGRVKAAVLLGQSAERLAEVCKLAGVAPIRLVESVPTAVQTAYELSDSGDVVLFSPSCASWDMFSSFEERGRIFKDAVHTL